MGARPEMPDSRKARPIIIHVIVFVLLFISGGAIINVAVAWVIAGMLGATPLEEGSYRELSSEVAKEYWLRHAPDPWRDAVILEGNAVESWGFGRADTMIIAEDGPQARLLAASHDDVGWPLLALRLTALHTVENKVVSTEVRWGWHVDANWLKSSTLPLRPIWPGFALNTIFYAAVLWVLFAAPGFVRRRLRRFRGRCVHCGYDRRGHVPGAESKKCPECGRNQAPKRTNAGKQKSWHEAHPEEDRHQARALPSSVQLGGRDRQRCRGVGTLPAAGMVACRDADFAAGGPTVVVASERCRAVSA